MKRILLATLLGAAFLSPAWADQLELPSPQQLVTMGIEQRLALYNAMSQMPPNERDANLKALRGEIDSLSPDQKEAMRQNFKKQFDALPPDQQATIKQQLDQGAAAAAPAPAPAR